MTISSTDLFTVVQPTVPLADPHVLSDIRDRRSIIDAIFDALVRRNDEGEFIPWLAESWSVEDDCRRWRFQLRAGVRCHNGAILTAFDAQASLLRALSPEMPGELGTQGVLRSYLQHAAVAVADNGVLTIDNPEPFADLLDLLVDIAIVPADSLHALPQQPIGSGPYQFAEQQPGRITLHAFDDHWAGKPPADTLVWLAEPDAVQRQALFARGEADLLVDPLFEPAGAEHIVSQRSYLCIIFLLNLFEGATQDVRVRKALNYAVNRQAIIAHPQIAQGHARPLAGPLTARHSVIPQDVQPYRYDPNAARQLLADAGYASGLKLSLALPARFPDESIVLARHIAEELQAVGVTVDLTIYEDRPAYAQRVRDKQFGDIACFDSSPASGWRIYREKLDSRQQGPWWQGYHSEALNALLDRAAATADGDQRAAMMRQAFTQVHDDAPWLFLYAPDHRWALGEKAHGWHPCAEGRVRIL